MTDGAKKIFLKLILFITPIAVGIGVVEYRLSKVPNTYNTKRKYLEAQSDSIEVLVLGSSHGAHGVNPDYFSHKGFNLANSSQPIYYDRLLTEKYLSRMPRLKLVIIPISYFSLYYKLANSDESWRACFYRRFWDLDCTGCGPTDPKRYSYILLYTQTEVVAMATDWFNDDLSNGMNRNGFLPKDSAKSWKNINDSLGRERVAIHNAYRSPETLSEVTADLDSLVSELRAKKIAVAFISTPVLPNYSKFCDQETLNANRQIINGLCKKYNCMYFDYFNDPRFKKDEFLNVDHLHFAGAAHFSRVLDEEIIDSVFKGYKAANTAFSNTP